MLQIPLLISLLVELLSKTMLALVLDIDHTIAHCILFTTEVERSATNLIHETNIENIQHQYQLNMINNRVNQTYNYKDVEVYSYLENNLHVIDVKEKNNVYVKYVVKFRPFLLHFLSIISNYYEITLYTNGTR